MPKILWIIIGYSFHSLVVIVCWPPVGPKDTRLISKYVFCEDEHVGRL